MRTYFIHDGNNQSGPYTLEELKNQNIQPHTSVWFEGMIEWTEARNIPELQGLYATTPPPFTFGAGVPEPYSTKSKKLALYIVVSLVLVALAGWAVYNSNNKDNGTSGTTQDISANTDTVTTTSNIPGQPGSSSPTTVISVDTTTSVPGDYITTRGPIISDTTTAADYVANHYTDDLRRELIAKEQESPLTYLSIEAEVTENLIGENVFKGAIVNSATAAPFKDMEILVTYYSGTDTELYRDNFTLYKYVAAGTKANFKIKRPGTPTDVKKFRIMIINASPAE